MGGVVCDIRHYIQQVAMITRDYDTAEAYWRYCWRGLRRTKHVKTWRRIRRLMRRYRREAALERCIAMLERKLKGEK